MSRTNCLHVTSSILWLREEFTESQMHYSSAISSKKWLNLIGLTAKEKEIKSINKSLHTHSAKSVCNLGNNHQHKEFEIVNISKEKNKSSAKLLNIILMWRWKRSIDYFAPLNFFFQHWVMCIIWMWWWSANYINWLYLDTFLAPLHNCLDKPHRLDHSELHTGALIRWHCSQLNMLTHFFSLAIRSFIGDLVLAACNFISIDCEQRDFIAFCFYWIQPKAVGFIYRSNQQ